MFFKQTNECKFWITVRTATNLALVHRASAYAFEVITSHLHRALVGLFVREMKMNQHNG